MSILMRTAVCVTGLAALLACIDLPAGSAGFTSAAICAYSEETESDYIVEDIGGGKGRIVMYTGLEDTDGGEGVSLVIPEKIDGLTITSLGEGAFMELPLTAVVIPEGVTEIGRSCFFRCSALKDISIPSTVSKVGANAFSSTAWIEEQSAEDGLVVVNGILVEAMYSEGKIYIIDDIKEIAENAFSQSNVTEVVLPAGLRCIRRGAFRECALLEDITLPKTTVLIEEDAFLDCPALKSVTIPKKLRNICNHAFGFSYDEDEEKYIRNDLRILCYEGSGGQEYAERYGFETEILSPEEGEDDDVVSDNLLGDVDLDGEITVVDAVEVINDINGVKPLVGLSFTAADVNLDGVVEVDDAVAIIAHVNGVKAIRNDIRNS